ncbi:MAG: PNP-UDP-1 domain-containing protein [Oscillospiraceae bacterium]|jgi:hypothetical protein
MVNIILCGDVKDTSVSQALISALSTYGGVIYSGPERIFQCGTTPQYLLYEYQTLPQIGLEKGVVLFKNSMLPQKPVSFPSNFLYVLETKNVRAAALLKDSGVTVVTCGTSSKETLSIAGLEEDTAVLSLQRTLKTLEGKMVEPHDFTVKFSGSRSPHQLLSVCAVLLIAGEDSLKGYQI